MPAPNRFNFTKASIDALPPPPPGKRPWYWDTKTPHLALRLSAGGGKAFYLYRWVADKAQQVSLGRYPEMTVEQARRKVEQLNGAVAVGIDPRKANASTRGEQTFEQLIDWFMEIHGRKKVSWRQDEQYFRRHVAPLLKYRISKVTRQDVRALHRRMGEQVGEYAANKALRRIRTIYNLAIKEEKFDGKNPAAGIDQFNEESRERRLVESELPAFIQAVAEEESADIRDFVLLCLFTGARKSNVLAMRWDQVDLVSKTWWIPVTKNGTSQTIPLHEEDIKILRRRQPSAAGPWVFPGRGETGHMRDPRKGWMRILSRAGIQDLHIHDLRRTLGSWMVDTGASIPIIGKTLHHQDPESTAIYARLSLNPVREAKSRAIDALVRAGEAINT